MKVNKLVTATLLFACSAFTLQAQDIGYPPDKSPYEDIPTHQRLTFYTGYFKAAKDQLGAIPQSAPQFGVRYEVTVGGPAQFFTRIAFVPSKRNAYDPGALPANRDLGEVSIPMYFVDLGFSFNLTGQKSWKKIVPTAGFAVGLVNANTQTEGDQYRFGTQFTISTELGLRYLLNDTWELRGNVGNTLYRTRYPNTYFVAGPTGESLLPANASRKGYKNNITTSLGLSYPIFR